jgi:phosphoglycerol transferase MdoB-like AlkP superfamily enzyme
MLLSSLVKLLRLFIFLLIVFAISRILFLIYFHTELYPNAFSLIPATLFNALLLDISAACYLLFVPVIILFSTFFSTQKLLRHILVFYMYLVAVLYILGGIGEIGVYREMRIKVYYSAFARIFHPSEILTYLSLTSLAAIAAALILVSAFSVFSFKKIVGDFSFKKSQINFRHVSSAFLFLLISVPLLVIGCRGGLQPVAINEGEVCFSSNQCVNDAAINTFWNLGHSYIETQKALAANNYVVMPNEYAKEIVRSLYAIPKDTTVSLFKTKRPNVCILILEGWSADLIESLGGFKGVTPNFERVIKQGYLFTNIESSGHISDQGLAVILGAYPALTFGSIINQNEKQLNLPCLGKNFGQGNYYTSFLYGGQLIYGGIKKFITLNKFNSITEQKTLPGLDAGKVGIHDSLMLNVWKDSLQSFQQPFFSCYFTLSTHVPYDAPTFHPITWGEEENQYLNSAAYADRQLGRFFEEMERTDFYDSTIFLIISDHGHHSPANHDYDSPGHYHIPFLVWGGALKEEFKGQKNNRLGSQLDLASTLLHQLEMNSNEFVWSKNLMNPYTKDFAFYAFNDGFGFMEPDRSVVWNRKFPIHDKNNGATQAEKDSLHKKGAALLQEVMNDFLMR